MNLDWNFTGLWPATTFQLGPGAVLFLMCFSNPQCAAVSTHCGAIKTPAQIYFQFCLIITTQGHCSMDSTRSPPTMRVLATWPPSDLNWPLGFGGIMLTLILSKMETSFFSFSTRPASRICRRWSFDIPISEEGELLIDFLKPLGRLLLDNAASKRFIDRLPRFSFRHRLKNMVESWRIWGDHALRPHDHLGWYSQIRPAYLSSHTQSNWRGKGAWEWFTLWYIANKQKLS